MKANSKDSTENLEHLLQIIRGLSEQDLQSLGRAIHERLRILSLQNSLKQLEKFVVGERVKFKHLGKVYKGVVIKINQRSISVHTDDSGHWNVTPNFLRKIKINNSR